MYSLRKGVVYSGFALTLATGTGTSAGAQGITFSSNLQCPYWGNTVYGGRSTKGKFKGSWADYIKSITMYPAGTATPSNPVANFANSTMDAVIRVPADADWETFDVTASVAPPLQRAFTQTIQVRSIPQARLAGASVPRADYYETVDITLSGSNLNGANVATATARIDESHAVTAYGGEMPRITNGATIPATVVSTTRTSDNWRAENNSRVVVRLSLPQKLTKITADVKLTGSHADRCSSFGTVSGSEAPPVVTRRVTMAVPAPPPLPYVQSIDVVNAIVGRDAEFTLTLNTPVPRPIAVMIMHWKLVPASSFTAATTSSTPYDASGGANRLYISNGQTVSKFKVHVSALPPGAINVGTVYLQTWISDVTNNTAPNFFQKQFTIATGNR
jgi:hypothetical protein